MTTTIGKCATCDKPITSLYTKDTLRVPKSKAFCSWKCAPFPTYTTKRKSCVYGTCEIPPVRQCHLCGEITCDSTIITHFLMHHYDELEMKEDAKRSLLQDTKMAMNMEAGRPMYFGL